MKNKFFFSNDKKKLCAAFETTLIKRFVFNNHNNRAVKSKKKLLKKKLFFLFGKKKSNLLSPKESNIIFARFKWILIAFCFVLFSLWWCIYIPPLLSETPHFIFVFNSTSLFLYNFQSLIWLLFILINMKKKKCFFFIEVIFGLHFIERYKSRRLLLYGF